jgi:hypothetical protein
MKSRNNSAPKSFIFLLLVTIDINFYLRIYFSSSYLTGDQDKTAVTIYPINKMSQYISMLIAHVEITAISPFLFLLQAEGNK